MTALYAYLAIWVLSMFGIIGMLISLLAKFIQSDSWSYDESFIWMKKIRE